MNPCQSKNEDESSIGAGLKIEEGKIFFDLKDFNTCDIIYFSRYLREIVKNQDLYRRKEYF